MRNCQEEGKKVLSLAEWGADTGVVGSLLTEFWGVREPRVSLRFLGGVLVIVSSRRDIWREARTLS